MNRLDQIAIPIDTEMYEYTYMYAHSHIILPILLNLCNLALTPVNLTVYAGAE